MKRRDFFRISGGSALLAATSAFSKSAEARNFPTSRKNRRELKSFPPRAASAVEERFREVLTWMQSKGWAPVLERLSGFRLDRAISLDDAVLFSELQFERKGALEEFGGARAIQPGDPAMSLLYHVLSASEAIFPELPAVAYPCAEQIDAVENYIFDRTSVSDTRGLRLAIFAYEYRQAFKTPHLAHADVVYARAGVSRTGTQDCAYDRVQREYRAPGASAGGPQDCATVSARFGLFLARPVNRQSVDRIGGNEQDAKFEFLLPVCKLVSGGRLLGGRGIQFQQSHRDEKLLRLMHEVNDPAEGFSLNESPFLRTSMSEDGPEGARTLGKHTGSLVTIRAMPGSARTFPEARPIARPAVQGKRLVRFRVPAETKGPLSNRRYTSLKLVQDRRAEVIDGFFSDYLFRGGRPTTGLRTPRNAPAFVYIRAAVTGDTELNYLSRSREELPKIASGGYDAALFEDGLCDGCVTARLTGVIAAELSSKDFGLPEKILSAISFVAAPDFFPRVDPLDIEIFDGMFLEGGTESASGLRLPANPLIELPGQPGISAFPIMKREPIAETMTAAISYPADVHSTYEAKGYARSSALNTLTDTISNVFFPGWDITYSNEPRLSEHRFLASFGLGSPFPEDMKLCAAANGMWAGASPDAARTFYGALERLPLWGRPATAVPLLDFELGFHPGSPARREWDLVPDHEYGWDGEHGPFIVLERSADGKATASVDCSDINLADYVRNALEKRMDLGRMQDLHNRDIIDRMAMLRTCIHAMPRGNRVATSDMWLVSAEKVLDWQEGASGLGVPLALAPRVGKRLPAAPGLQGPGYVFLFAHCPSPGEGKPFEPGRLRFPVQRLYMCQGDARQVRFATLEADLMKETKLRWSEAHEMRYGRHI